VEALWCALGGAVCACGVDLDYADGFLALLGEIEAEAEELDLVRLARRVAERYATPEAEGAAVEVMTIHRSHQL